jgi:hypothetical protein
MLRAPATLRTRQSPKGSGAMLRAPWRCEPVKRGGLWSRAAGKLSVYARFCAGSGWAGGGGGGVLGLRVGVGFLVVGRESG